MDYNNNLSSGTNYIILSNETNIESNTEPNAEPNTEPNIEPNAEPNIEPNNEPNAEPNIEPNNETNAELNCKIIEQINESTKQKYTYQQNDPIPKFTLNNLINDNIEYKINSENLHKKIIEMQIEFADLKKEVDNLKKLIM